MTKEDILHHFQDINFRYNDCMMYDDLSRMLDELIPENVHGEWIKHDTDHLGYYIECSNCHSVCGKYLPYKHFCPNCGADMRKEIFCTAKDEEIAKQFIDDVESVKDLLP